MNALNHQLSCQRLKILAYDFSNLLHIPNYQFFRRIFLYDWHLRLEKIGEKMKKGTFKQINKTLKRNIKTQQYEYTKTQHGYSISRHLTHVVLLLQ